MQVKRGDWKAEPDSQGNIVGLKLRQVMTGTFTANGVTLHESDHRQIFVDFVDGLPVLSKHVGVEFHLRGPDGRIALVTGQTVFEVVNGFDAEPVRVVHRFSPNGEQCEHLLTGLGFARSGRLNCRLVEGPESLLGLCFYDVEV